MNGSSKRSVLWGALFGSTAVYLVLALLLGRGDRVGGEAGMPILSIVLAVVAVGNGLAATFFWRRARAAQAESAAHAGPRTEQPPESLTPWIVCWGLDESVAILGFILALLGFPPSVWLGFFAGAAVLLVVHR